MHCIPESNFEVEFLSISNQLTLLSLHTFMVMATCCEGFKDEFISVMETYQTFPLLRDY